MSSASGVGSVHISHRSVTFSNIGLLYKGVGPPRDWLLGKPKKKIGKTSKQEEHTRKKTMKQLRKQWGKLGTTKKLVLYCKPRG